MISAGSRNSAEVMSEDDPPPPPTRPMRDGRLSEGTLEKVRRVGVWRKKGYCSAGVDLRDLYTPIPESHGNGFEWCSDAGVATFRPPGPEQKG